MEVIEYILLAESDEQRVADTIFKTLGIEPQQKHCLTVTSDFYDFDVCIIGKTGGTEAVEFFERQIESLHNYYEAISIGSKRIQVEILNQISAASTLVILHYRSNSAQRFPNKEAATVVTTLLQEYQGVYLSDHNQNLLEEDLILVLKVAITPDQTKHNGQEKT